MLNAIQISSNAYWIGTNDRETTLFENIWPIPRGISYNAYLLTGENNILIDTVKSCYFDAYLDGIKDLIGNQKIDYLIVNHMEPDHSGSMKLLLSLYPDLKIIANAKTLPFLRNFYQIENNILIVEDGQELILGDITLQFYMIPMVHWPETMVTYDPVNGILYPCDAFGGFGALEGGIFDDQVDLAYFENEMLRYYANIVGKYSPMVQKALAKLGGLQIKMIAPSHGPVWRSHIPCVLGHYDKWSKNEAEEGIVLVYGSMYGNTLRLMEEIAKGIASRNFKTVRVHNISDSHPSYILTDIWRYKGVILGAPTYNMELFPPMEYLLQFLENKMLKNRLLGIFGNYSWSSFAVKRLQEFGQKVKWEVVSPVVEIQSCPRQTDLQSAFTLGQQMVDRIRDLHIKPADCH